MTAPRAREQADPPSPPDRRPPRRGGGSSPSPYRYASAAGRPADPVRPAGARRGLVRSARALAAAALLALSGALALPATAQTVVLVSNTGQADDGARPPFSTGHFAQPFDTGSNTTGYNLASVVLDFTDAPTGTGTVTVTVREDNAGVPSDTVLYTMTGGTLVSGENEFTAPTGASLNGSTLYHVVLEYDAVDGGPTWTRTQLSNGVDSGNADGWDIDDAGIRGQVFTSGTTWSVAWSSRAFQIQVKGSAKSGGTPPPLSTDATLSGLTVHDGSSNLTLSPAFASGTEAYTAAAASGIAAVTVTPATTDADATFEYLDSSDAALADADSGTAGHQVALAAGPNVIKVKVTAEDGTTTKTYTVTVTRATPTCSLNAGDLWCGVVTVGSGTGFDGYAPSVGALSDTTFSVGSNDYTIDAIVAEIGGFTDGRLTVSLVSGLTSADRAKLVLHLGSTEYEFSDATEAGFRVYGWIDAGLNWSSETFVTLRLRDTPAPSTDATLSALSVTGGGTELITGFASDTYAYTASVASGVGEATVAATATDSNATVAYQTVLNVALDDANGTEDGHQVTLAVGATQFNVVVTAEDGTTTQTYTVHVSRAVPLPTLDIVDDSKTEGSLMVFVLQLSTIASENVTVACTASFGSDDTAVAGDLTSTSASGLIRSGQNRGTCSFSSAQDAIDEEDETFTVTLSNPSSNAQLGTRVAAKGTIEDDDDPPTVSVGDVSGEEGTALTFTVALSAASGKTVTVDWAASAESGDTATAGTDFTAVAATTLTFDAGQEEKTVTVQTTEDSAAENDETFTVTLSSPSNATIPDATAKGTIEDDDGTTLPTLSVGNSLGTEGSIIDFPLTLSAAASADVTVTCTASIESGDTAAAADLSSNTSGTATITASGTSGRCSIRTVQDTIDEEDETFTVTLSNVSSNAQLATDPTAKGTIVDDDTAPTVTDVSVTSTPVLATGTYGAGETIEVSVTFDEAVNATSATDFELNVSDDKSAPLLRGSGTQTLVFGYTVAPGDADDNGIWIGDQDRTLVGDRRLTTQAGAITSTATGTAADLTHTELGRQDNHKVDGTRSIVSVAVTSTPQLETDTYGAGETIQFTVTFNVAVDVTGDPVLEFLLDGSEVRQASDVSGSGTTTLVFSYTVVSGDDDDNGLFIRDESDYNNPDGPVRLDSNDEIEFKDTSTDVPLYWAGRGTQSGHKVDGSRTTDNVAPSFTSSATFDAAENETAVGTVLAADSDADDSVTGYAIAGGADMALFEIGATSGELAFKTAPDFEDPDTDNVHEVTVRATSGTGTREMTATQTITVTVTDAAEQSAKPDKPELEAVSGSSTSLTATWETPELNGGPAITGYKLEYKLSTETSWTAFAHTGAAVTTTITGLTADTAYQARVRAENGETDSDWSDASDAVSTNAETVTPTCTLDTAAGDIWCGVLTVGAVSSSQDGFFGSTGGLTDTTFSVGSSNYMIEQLTVNNSTSTNAGDLLLGLGRDRVLSLANRARLVLHVDDSGDMFAFNASAASGFSLIWTGTDLDWSSATTVTLRLRLTPEVPGKPTNLMAEADGSTRIALSWEAPADDGGSEITGYRIEVSDDAGSNWDDLVDDTGNDDTTYTHTGLSPGDTRHYRVSAINAEGTSDASDSDSATTVAAGTCTLNPGDIWCGVVTVALHTVGGSDFGYGFADASESTNTSDTGALSDNDGNKTFTFGTNNYTVDFAVVLGVGDGILTFSLTGALTAADRAKLILHVDDSSGSFAFSDSTDPTSQHSYAWTSTGLDWSSETSVTLRLREANTAPVFADGFAQYNLPENSAANTAVGRLTATDADDDTLTYSLEGPDAASFAIDSGTGEFKTRSGVTYDFEAAQNIYYMTVKADDGNGGTDTIDVTIALLDADEKSAKPDKPKLEKVTGSSTSLTATWEAPGLNGGPAITGYKLEYRGAPAGTWMDFEHTGTAVTTTITGLTADTSYQARVRAENGDTDSDWSDASDAVSTNAVDIPIPPGLEVTLHLSEVAVLEDATPVTVTATVSPASPVAFTVEISASPVAPATADEFELSTNRTLRFAAGATGSTGTVTIRPVDDDEPEPPDVVTISGAVSNPAIPNPDDVTLTIHNNDVEFLEVAVDAPAAVDEDAGTATVTYTLTKRDGAPVANTDVNFYHGNAETATRGLDYTPPVAAEGLAGGRLVVLELSLPPSAFSNTAGTVWVWEGSFEIGIVDDQEGEPDETIVFTVEAGKGESPRQTIVIRDDDRPPAVSIAAANATVLEGQPAVFTLSRTGATGSALTATVALTEQAGRDLLPDGAATERTATFARGASTAALAVELENDELTEPDGDLTAAVQAGAGYTVGDPSSATVTVEDDDAPTPPVIEDIEVVSTPRLRWRNSREEDTYGEGENIRIEVRFDQTVHVEGYPVLALEVGDPCISVCEARYESGSGTDTLVFAYLVLDTEIDRNGVAIPASPIGASIDEFDGFSIRNDWDQEARLSYRREGTKSGHKADGTRQAAPHLSVEDAEAHEADGEMAFTVRLEPRGLGIVTVDYATRDGSGDKAAVAGEDYTETRGTLRFNPLETERTVPVPIIDDDEEDDGETFTLRLSNPDGARLKREEREARGTIRNSDPKALSASFPASAFASASHSGADDRPQAVVAFSEAVAEFAADTPSVSVTGATVASVRPHAEDGLEHAWVFFLVPDGAGDVTFALVADAACAAGGICTAGGRTLTEVPAASTIPGPGDPEEAPLTGRFEGLPAEHDGESAFTFRIAFSEPLSWMNGQRLREDVVAVAGGRATKAGRVNRRRDLWELTVEPDSLADVTVTLEAGAACGTPAAVCAKDGRALSETVAATVAGPDGAPANAPAAGAPTIRGTAQVGETLSTSTSGVSDADGLENATFAYQWIRTGTDIQGAAGPTYTAVGADEGKTLQVRVGFTDDAGHSESLTSAATGPVEAAPRANTAAQPMPKVSVADARVHEAAGATLDFAVTLSAAAPGPVTVDYRTVDASAKAGEDYEARSGTLSFAAGETEKTLRVTVLDDAVDEGDETMVVVLDPGAGVARGDRLAVGIIENSDPMPRAWLARFGRTASDHVVEAIAERWRGGEAQRPRTHFTLGGRAAGNLFGGGDANGGVLHPAGAGNPALADDSSWEQRDRLNAEAPGPAGSSPLAGSNPLAGGGLGGDPVAGRGPAGGGTSGGQAARYALMNALGLPTGDLRDVLMGSSFFYSRPLDEAGGQPGGLGQWSAWGRTAATRFSGAGGKLTLNGEVATAILGVDSRRNRWLAGVTLSYSEGEGAYTQPGAGGGGVRSTLTSLNPYLQYRFSERTHLWAVAGYGVGGLTLTPESSESVIDTDLEHAMAAFGGRGVFSVRSSRFGAFEFAVRSDALVTNTVSAASEHLISAAGAASRVRLMLEGSGSMPLGSGGMLRPTLEAGLRYDGGDAETGAGLEIGGGLGYAAGALAVEVRARLLLAHQDTEYEEWGFSGSIRYQPQSGGRGLSVNLGSTWGQAQSGVQSLWTRPDASGLAPVAAMHAAQRFQAEFGYGFAGRRAGALWTPYAGIDTSGGRQALRLGVKLASGDNAEAGLEVGRLDSGRASGRADGIAGPDHAVQLRGSIRW